MNSYYADGLSYPIEGKVYRNGTGSEMCKDLRARMWIMTIMQSKPYIEVFLRKLLRSLQSFGPVLPAPIDLPVVSLSRLRVGKHRHSSAYKGRTTQAASLLSRAVATLKARTEGDFRDR